MSKNFFFISFFFLLASCYHENQDEVTKPDHFIPEEKMIVILTDLQLQEGIMNFKKMKNISIPGSGELIFDKILFENQVSYADLKENLDYYNSNPEKMEKMYEAVLARLTIMQGEVTAQAKSDSLASAIQKSETFPDSLAYLKIMVFAKDSSIKYDTAHFWNYLHGPHSYIAIY